jgi:hypothetical protein
MFRGVGVGTMSYFRIPILQVEDGTPHCESTLKMEAVLSSGTF